MKETRKITFAALFIAIDVILKVYLTFFLFGTTKFGFSFIPAVVSSASLGPLWGGITGGLADLLGYFIKQDGTYFPGFTASAIIKGLLYGLFLFKKPKSIKSIVQAVLSAMILVDLGLNSLWINMLYGTKISAVFISKLATLPLFAIIQILILYILFKSLGKEISKISE